ncbi:hypothetical protein [Bradyrhizobium sp. USDA 10063]
MRIFVSFLIFFVVCSKLSAAECPGSHCSAIGNQINDICKSDGFSGNVVYVVGPGGLTCYCHCSCMSFGTIVAINEDQWKKIEDFRVGDKVLTLQSDNTWKETEVKFSAGTKGNNQPLPFTVFIELEDGIQLIVTPDHPFMLPDGKLRRASKLTLSDKLVSAGLKPVAMKRLEFGIYTGGIHNIATSTSLIKESKYGHLINTGGIISGDYYAQIMLAEDDDKDLPAVGTTSYAAQANKMTSIKTETDIEPRVIGTNYFTPYKAFKPPVGAIHFLPEGTQPKEGTLRPLTDPVPREIAEYLVHHFSRFYPDVTYHVEWADNTVNAYAWIEGGRRHVALLGGLIRHQAMGVEGLSLVTAHELGHHYGGAPTYPNSPLACEGQADYWGARSGMREVWWGPEYVRQMQEAIPQLDQLFQGIIVPTESSAGAFLPPSGHAAPLTCGHPPAACRKATYQAALEAQPKPVCAGVAESVVAPLTPRTQGAR